MVVPSSLPTLSTDAMIVAAAALVFAYGVVAGYVALVRESISVYVGLVLANTFGQPLHDYLVRSAGSGFPVTETMVRLILLILPIVVLQLVRRHHGHPLKHHGMLVTLLLAALAALLIISSVISQLDQVTLSNTLENSNLASWIYQLRLVWLAGVPLAIAVGAVLHPHRHRAH